ncbi:MAG TPA: tripartite tricarboxylate transporter substrate binding protein, partial [Pseudonocardiaceae bacterium]|nr:tripartite tricarboxylate transporter substrate binding protein [Pseudonocardiaceae bacterium]
MAAIRFRHRAARSAAVLLALVTLAACQIAAGGAGGGGAEEEFPTKPISMVVGFAPGGGADVFARALTRAAQQTLPEQVVVENREGGSGTSASAFVHGQPADGYTILFGHAGSTILTPTISNSPQLKWDAFAPVARIHAEEEFLFLRPDAAWDTIEELVQYARDNPGAVRVGGSAVGGVDSFVVFQLEKAAGVDFTYVPFDGGGPASMSFLGGNVDVLIGNLSDNVSSVDSGEMRPIAVASAQRGPQTDVPTLAENGWDVVLQQWRGVFAPKGTPPERIKILADGFEAALGEQAWVTYRESS